VQGWFLHEPLLHLSRLFSVAQIVSLFDNCLLPETLGCQNDGAVSQQYLSVLLHIIWPIARQDK